jgi:hypothetical protein
LKGIRDEDIKEVIFKSEHLGQMQSVQDFLTNCYLNISVVAMKSYNSQLTLDACNEVLSYNPRHVKALFLRSKALVTPKSGGATENDLAIKDLRLALQIEPKNKSVR